MTKRIVRVSSNKRAVKEETNRINASFKERNIKREAYLSTASYSYVRKRTRKGHHVTKNNYTICVRNKK